MWKSYLGWKLVLWQCVFSAKLVPSKESLLRLRLEISTLTTNNSIQQIVLNCRTETFLGSLDVGLAEWFLDLQLVDVCKRLDVVVQTVEALSKGAVYLCLRLWGGLIRPIRLFCRFDLYLIPPITDEQFLVEDCAIGTKSGVPWWKKVKIQKSKNTCSRGMWGTRVKSKSIPGKMTCSLPISITHLIEPNMLELYPQ